MTVLPNQLLHPLKRRAFMAIPVLALLSVKAMASDADGYDGLTASIKADGFFLNPTLVQVTVVKVDAGSPAHSAGIGVGDQIAEIEGITVVGTIAKTLKPHLSKKLGESTNMVLVRLDGMRYSARLVAVKSPK